MGPRSAEYCGAEPPTEPNQEDDYEVRHPNAEALIRADLERYTRETGQFAGVGGWSDYLEWLEHGSKEGSDHSR